MKMILLTEGETMSRLFDLDWQLLADSCLMIIAIFVLFLALSYFLFNPARKFLNDRKEKIRGELEEAKTSQEKAAGEGRSRQNPGESTRRSQTGKTENVRRDQTGDRIRGICHGR